MVSQYHNMMRYTRCYWILLLLVPLSRQSQETCADVRACTHMHTHTHTHTHLFNSQYITIHVYVSMYIKSTPAYQIMGSHWHLQFQCNIEG